MPITPNPDADFTPDRYAYSGTGEFRFWCQTVLPLVYDDSLSYYELLNKVVNYLNSVIRDLGFMETNVTNLFTAYTQLENYVNNYFHSLDVQQEIDAKLDEMASNGSLNALIDPLIPVAVSAWLAEHIEPTEPPVDDTLSIEGAAADAKATGDAIDDINTALYGSKNTDTNTAVRFTYWNSGAETPPYSDENPVSPLDMPINSYTMGTGSRLAGFDNDLFSLSDNPNSQYFVWCWANLHNTAIREYMIYGTTVIYFGRKAYNSDTVTWSRGTTKIDDTLTESGSAPDSATVGSVIYRSKDRAANDAVGLTYWKSGSATPPFSDENPVGPLNMPVNTYTMATGARLAGFNNDLFTLSSGSNYFVWCWANLVNIQIKEFIIVGTGVVFIGRKESGSDTITWKRVINLIDRTLTNTGEAADAKATGDAINEVKGCIRGNPPVQWQQGTINQTNGKNNTSSTRCRLKGYRPANRTGDVITANTGYVFSLRWYYDNAGTYYQSTSGWKLTYDVDAALKAAGSTFVKYYRIVVAKRGEDDASGNPTALNTAFTPTEAANALNIVGAITAEEVWQNAADITELKNGTDTIEVFETNTGNSSIRAAKMHHYTDGTPPEIEWFLLQEPGTGNYYWADKDLTRKKFLFSFSGHEDSGWKSGHYNFGIMPNGDIIACVDCINLSDNHTAHDDSLRQNPYVWLASENWKTAHEVDFSTTTNYPPCAWIENTGFCAMPDGSAIFGEYTRAIVAHCYVWKLSGDITDPENWQIVKTFETGVNNEDGFKHCHAVMLDHFTGIIYLATGDDDIGARIYYSLPEDAGEEWTQLAGYPLMSDSDPNEKYCRLVNIIFTKNGAWWGSDTNKTNMHYLFFTTRNENTGILNWNYANLGNGKANLEYDSFATYGLAYIPEINSLLIMDRSDGNARPATQNVRLAVIDDSGISPTVTIKTIGTLNALIDTSISPNQPVKNIGFRCRFKEFYPYNGYVRCGFGLMATSIGDNRNQIAAFGNEFTTGSRYSTLKINNLTVTVSKNGNDYNMHLGTIYI